MIRKILAPVDGSDVTERVVDVACDLSKLFDASLTLAHVIVLPVTIEPGVAVDPAPLERVGQRILESAKRVSEKRGCSTDVMMESAVGNAGHRIVWIAKENDFDLIVIGARGIGKIEALLLGSVCDTVTHSASCPVLVVR
jgi:nucleotide-binding universal stress UspA family protein